jgi:hypothetical protein
MDSSPHLFTCTFTDRYFILKTNDTMTIVPTLWHDDDPQNNEMLHQEIKR